MQGLTIFLKMDVSLASNPTCSSYLSPPMIALQKSDTMLSTTSNLLTLTKEAHFHIVQEILCQQCPLQLLSNLQLSLSLAGRIFPCLKRPRRLERHLNPTREKRNCVGLFLQPRVSPYQVENVWSRKEREETDQDASQTFRSLSKSLHGFFLTKKDPLGRYPCFLKAYSFLHDIETHVCLKKLMHQITLLISKLLFRETLMFFFWIFEKNWAKVLIIFCIEENSITESVCFGGGKVTEALSCNCKLPLPVSPAT